MLSLGLAALASVALAEVYFKETFEGNWLDRWTIPNWKKGELGDWKAGPGTYNSQNGLKSSQDAKFYAAATKFSKPFSNDGKDLVIQFQVAFPQSIDCGGGYIKIFGDKLEPKDYSGESAYNIMFGPDICGSTKKVHVIFNDKDSGDNLDQVKSKEVSAESDKNSHVYTLVVKPDNTYAVRVDGSEKKTGSLKEDWSFLEPKEIDDPNVKKPDDWVEEAMMDDPEDKKPEGYDDIPKTIVDPEAEKPEDWDEEDDGEWEAPMIDNPEYKGPWKPKRISNPNYKGPWVQPKIANPDFVDNDELYKYTFGGVGIDIWQVKSGTEYRNMIITDSLDEAEAFRKETFGETQQKAEKDAIKAETEAEAAKAKAESEADEDEDEEEAHDEL